MNRRRVIPRQPLIDVEPGVEPAPRRRLIPRPVAVTVQLQRPDGTTVAYPKPKTKSKFNWTPNDGISWANWSWNPVVGCEHGCTYCYAREIAENPGRASIYPTGFAPVFHPERLDAPVNTKPGDGAKGRVFVVSMGDLFGKWVPDQWITDVFDACRRAPDWTYIYLTKFPSRYKNLPFPPKAWVGASVDNQRRANTVAHAMRDVTVPVRWLSIEPLLEPVQFDSLSMFDWVVIGAQTAQPRQGVKDFAPPFEWVASIVAQARQDGVKVHLKPNLHQRPGMEFPDEYPEG